MKSNNEKLDQLSDRIEYLESRILALDTFLYSNGTRDQQTLQEMESSFRSNIIRVIKSRILFKRIAILLQYRRK
jgi:hypothetical protein